jgi:lipid-binding SYLF domain-containing protein
MMRTLTAAMVLALTTATAHAGDLSTKETERIREAARVLMEIHTVPDKDIPEELWERAQCVIVVPSLKKAAFVFGGEYGKV